MIKARVSYTQEHFGALLDAVNRRNRRRSDIFWDAVMLLCIIVTAWSIITLIVKDIPVTPRMISSFLIFGTVLVIRLGAVIFLRTIPRRAARRYQKQGGRPIDLTFGCDGFTAESAGEKRSFAWEHISGAERSKGYFVIFRTKKTAFMLSDSDITDGTADELDALFAEKLGERYKRIDTAQRRHGR